MALILIRGTSGSGKSHLIEQLEPELFCKINGDSLTRHIVETYFPKTNRSRNWYLVNRLIPENSDLFYDPVYSVAEYLEAEGLIHHKEGRHIVFEGVILEKPFWFERILRGFEIAGFEFLDQIHGVLHNPPVEVILRQHKKRRLSTRIKGEALTPEVAKKRRSGLSNNLILSSVKFRETTSTSESLDVINGFLSGEE